ncbi:MAG: ACT domain-containing protein, partial [Rhodoluna sp.]
MTSEAKHWVLTLVCDDQPGIVHAISGAVVSAAGNITESQQFSSEDTGRFFIRLQIESSVSREAFVAELQTVIDRYGMTWHLDEVGRKVRTLVLVSKS